MNPYLISISLLVGLVNISVCAQPTSTNQYQRAKQNFESTCVRSIPDFVLLKNKVQQHHFTMKYSMDEFPLIYGFETAKLNAGQSIRVENVGCESFGFNIQLILNADNIEENQKLCQSCLVQELKKLSIYFKNGNDSFYLDGIKALQQHFSRHQQFKINQSYQLKGSDEMPQTFNFHQLLKQKNGQYLISFTNSVGPL